MTDQYLLSPLPPMLQPKVRDHLGELLQQLLPPADAQMPGALSELVQDLTAALAARDAGHADSFRAGLIAAMPKLRNFAISLTRNQQRADDLVQDTMVKALRGIDKFQHGTNLDAWLFTILRNNLLSDYRRGQREVEDPEGAHAGRVAVAPEQVDRLSHQDLRAALAKLSPPHREALMLVGAQGMSYEETAEICGVPVGTVKSRVNRARTQLGLLLAEDGSFGFDGVTTAVLGSAGTG